MCQMGFAPRGSPSSISRAQLLPEFFGFAKRIVDLCHPFRERFSGEICRRLLAKRTNWRSHPFRAGKNATRIAGRAEARGVRGCAPVGKMPRQWLIIKTGRLGLPAFIMSHLADSDCRPARYECAALPTELKWLVWDCKNSQKKENRKIIFIFLSNGPRGGRCGP